MSGSPSAGSRTPLSAESSHRLKMGRPLKSDPQPPFVPAVVSRLADAESVGIFVATDLPQCNWPAGPHPGANAPSAALRDGPFPRTNPRLTYSQSSQGPRSRGVIMLTINGRPIAFHEYRRRRQRRPERALVPLTLIIAAGVWLLT